MITFPVLKLLGNWNKWSDNNLTGDVFIAYVQHKAKIRNDNYMT